MQDAFKVSGAQVAPRELEDVILAHPAGLVADAAVAGVRRPGAGDDRMPRAWVVLSAAGRAEGEAGVVQALDDWVRERLSGYKRLR